MQQLEVRRTPIVNDGTFIGGVTWGKSAPVPAVPAGPAAPRQPGR
jgi:hypothetical protein